ncbi:transcription factor Rba50 like protein [Zymoseptoria brevis]|uniref:Transcription factor Rba50 like protein n=1 Tax=Zymoseptoria brevis TaxID=1047168 RepID=A0A0F4GIY0_9PEZI|nr:transcription factor Rba50 like protein [Zymoseptoria brevis]
MIRGTKFELNLDDEEEEGEDETRTVLPAAFVGHVLERKPAAPKAPSMPVLKNHSGFPEHKKRGPGESRFKQKQHPAAVKTVSLGDAPTTPHSSNGASDGKAKSWEEEEEEEKSRIDAENRQKLAEMSFEEIEEERRELMSSLGPAMIERLLKRANVADGSEEVDLSKPMGWKEGEEDDDHEVLKEGVQDEEPRAAPVKSKPSKTVTFEDSPPPPPPVSRNDLPSNTSDPAAEQVLSDARHPDPQHSDARHPDPQHSDARHPDPQHSDAQHPDPQPSDAQHPDSQHPPHDSIHFPQPVQPPSLDPSSSTFLTDLHTKYFPSLPSDPQKLEWMQPDSNPSPYAPDATALSPDQIRFSFRGELIPPSQAATIPVTQGLHHHGDAPEAAGYTIPELAHLARSSYPAQRCIAFQTLGRILFRLGTGEFGFPEVEAERAAVEAGRGEVEGKGELARGLWREVERLKVVEGLVEEAEGKGVDKGRHLSARTYATEAVWLWRRGGGEEVEGGVMD